MDGSKARVGIWHLEWICCSFSSFLGLAGCLLLFYFWPFTLERSFFSFGRALAQGALFSLSFVGSSGDAS